MISHLPAFFTVLPSFLQLVAHAFVTSVIQQELHHL